MNPIIFCHYGNRKAYLPYVLRAAVLSNRDKRVVLLGDRSNRWIARRAGADFYEFSDFQSTSVIKRFDAIYQLIDGANHGSIRGKKDWVNFVFRRWFYVYEFVQREGIEKFWHFDSDNMILASLADFERPFSRFDCTEQCGGACMNGFISSVKVLEEYLLCIIELFEDDLFLNEMRERMRENSGHAFTEMTAFLEFKKRYNPKVWHARDIQDGASFDDCICQSHGFAMELCEPIGKQVKRLFLSDRGIYGYDQVISVNVRFPVINLSWVPTIFFWVLLKHLKISQRKNDTGFESCELSSRTLCEEVTSSWKSYNSRRSLLDRLFRLRLWFDV